jgi:hypothetical protein
MAALMAAYLYLKSVGLTSLTSDLMKFSFNAMGKNSIRRVYSSGCLQLRGLAADAWDSPARNLIVNGAVHEQPGCAKIVNRYPDVTSDPTFSGKF